MKLLIFKTNEVYNFTFIEIKLTWKGINQVGIFSFYDLYENSFKKGDININHNLMAKGPNNHKAHLIVL